MSPKLRTRQPKPTIHAPEPVVTEPRIEALFWVRVTVPQNCRGLVPRQDLTLYPDESRVMVLRGAAPLGMLSPEGVRWVRSHSYFSCVFVKYGRDPSQRFQVRIAAG